MQEVDSEPDSIKDIQILARFLDSKFSAPLGFRFGWDGILGLIPGVGDIFTSTFSLYIIARAAALGCTVPVLLRMGLNVWIDNLLAAIPILGNVVDFFWKSNLRNLKLLEQHLKDRKGTTRSSWLALALVFAGIALLSLAIVALGVYALLKLLQNL